MHLTGLVLIVLGGVMEGLFALPMRFAPRWAWENFWGAGSLMALLLVPWPLALLTVPHLGSIYASADSTSLLLAILFGAGWGCGGIFFGLGVASLGLSLGTSLIMGLIAIGGSVVPLLLDRNLHIAAGSKAALACGIALMVLGLMICARAGNLKSAEPGRSTRSIPFGVGYSTALRPECCPRWSTLRSCSARPLRNPPSPVALIPRPQTTPFGQSSSQSITWSISGTASFALPRRQPIEVPIGLPSPLLVPGDNHGTFMGGRNCGVWPRSVPGRTIRAGFGFPIMLVTSILTGNAAGALSGEWRHASLPPDPLCVGECA